MKAKEIKYCCPMHRDIQGKLNDICSKCGMLLTVFIGENAGKQNVKYIKFETFVENYNRNLIQNITI